MSRIFGFVYHDTNGLNHGPVWKTQSFHLNGICTVIFWQTIVGTAIWESSIGTRLGKSFKLGMFICQPSKRTIPISVCGRYQIGRQNRNCRVDLENSHELWIIKKYVRIQDFCWSLRKTTDQCFREIWCRNNIFLVLWRGRSCKEIRGNKFRTCK